MYLAIADNVKRIAVVLMNVSVYMSMLQVYSDQFCLENPSRNEKSMELMFSLKRSTIIV